MARHKKVKENAKLSSEPNASNAGSTAIEKDGGEKVKNDDIKGVIEIQEVTEDDLTSPQMNARAQFFQDIYNSTQLIKKGDMAVNISVNLTGMPLVKYIENIMK